MLGRYEENAYFWRMMRVAGSDVRIYESTASIHGNMPAGRALRGGALYPRDGAENGAVVV